MSTLTAMLTEMQADMERSSATDVTAMRNKISAAIRVYQRKRFFFNESRTLTFSTVAGTDTYTFNTAFGGTGTIGAQFYRIDGVFISISGQYTELNRADYAEIEVTADNYTGRAQPTDYAYVGRTIRLWPNPDQIYPIRILGHQFIAEPASDAETGNVWMTEAYDLIMARAKAELFAHTYSDPQSAIVAQQAERLALSDLRSDTYRRAEGGMIVPTEW